MPALSSASAPPFHQRLVYASGNMGKSWIWASFDTVLLYYLSSILGLPLAVAGHILMLSLIWDGFSNLMLSYLADRSRNRHVFRQFLLIGAPLCAASFFLIFFSGYSEVSPPALWLGLICLICRTGYTLCDVAHNSMLANMSTSVQGASSVSALRLIFSAAGGIAVGLGFKYAFDSHPEQQLSAFLNFALLGAGLYVLTVGQAALLPQSRIEIRENNEKISIFKILRTLFDQKEFQILCLLVSLHAGIISLFHKGLPFLGKALLDDPSWSGDALIYITIGKVVLLLAFQFVAARLPSLRTIMFASYSVLGVALLLLLVSASGPLPTLPPILLLIGGAEAGIGMCIWARLASFVNAISSREGLALALPFGVFLAVLKAANGIGSEIFTAGVSMGSDASWNLPLTLGGVAMGLPLVACGASLLLVSMLKRL